MVKCFHRQLKTAFKAYLNSTHWTEPLPIILLSISAVVKQDLGCSAAEIVYGTTLRPPAAFSAHNKGQPGTNGLCTKPKETNAKPASSSSSFQSTRAGTCSV